jgi:hypothetical protein
VFGLHSAVLGQKVKTLPGLKATGILYWVDTLANPTAVSELQSDTYKPYSTALGIQQL